MALCRLKGPWPLPPIAAVLLCTCGMAGIRGVEHYLTNAASLDAQCLPLAHRELEGWPISHAVDGKVGVGGWSWGTELDQAEAVFVLKNMYTLTGIRVFSGMGAGCILTRFSLWYTTSVPENVSDPKMFSGGWGMSDGRWMSIPFLQADAPDDENIAVQENIVLTARPDSMMHFPPLLVRALKIVIEDTSHEGVPAVINEFQAIAPRHLNPGADMPDLIQRPARGYIPPFYNTSDAYYAANDAQACAPSLAGAHEHEVHAEAADYDLAEDNDPAQTPWFSWAGALEHNESVVYGTLKAHVRVHNFAIPEEGRLELYVQNTRAAFADDSTVVHVSIAELSHGLHVFTARLRARNGEWLPYNDRRVAFVASRPPVHPWLLSHNIEVVGDGLSDVQVGVAARLRNPKPEALITTP
jgi:hypothetical protein